MAQAFVIADTAVQQDADGRFSLNDLHRASGGAKRHQPNYWLENQQTKDLIEELQTTGIPAVSKLPGRSGGTFVARELVYAYAMWISARFHLQVIRAYDQLVQDLSPGPERPALTVPQLLAAQRQAHRLLLAMQATPLQQMREMLYEQLVAVQRLLGARTPLLADLLGPQKALPGTEGDR